MNQEFEDRLGYAFSDKSILKEALTHSTYANEHRSENVRDNQRLEFLGDTIVNAAVALRVYFTFPDAAEGRLTKLRAELINEAALARLARSLSLGEVLLLGKGEELDGGRDKPSILADAFEAIIGAVFLDGSYEEACRVVEKHMNQAMGEIDELEITDYKSVLIEFCQASLKKLPEMVLESESGPEHDKLFAVSVRLSGKTIGMGSGKSKKIASQEACREALIFLNYRQ